MRNLIWLVMMSCSGEVKDTGESGPGGESVVTGDSGATDCAPAEETCDGVDNDCDGEVDEAEAADASSWYRDGDGDGLGDPAASSTACEAPDGYVAEASDCDDQDASVGPGRAWYLDEDGDGYGGASTTESCVAPEGYVAYGGDCDDGDPAYNPGGTESDCRDPNDYNCDGSVGYSDADGDGYAACEECDDSSSEVRPDAEERCDGIDDAAPLTKTPTPLLARREPRSGFPRPST